MQLEILKMEGTTEDIEKRRLEKLAKENNDSVNGILKIIPRDIVSTKKEYPGKKNDFLYGKVFIDEGRGSMIANTVIYKDWLHKTNAAVVRLAIFNLVESMLSEGLPYTWVIDSRDFAKKDDEVTFLCSLQEILSINYSNMSDKLTIVLCDEKKKKKSHEDVDIIEIMLGD